MIISIIVIINIAAFKEPAAAATPAAAAVVVVVVIIIIIIMIIIHKPESALENETLKILRNFELRTDHLILARKPDLCDN